MEQWFRQNRRDGTDNCQVRERETGGWREGDGRRERACGDKGKRREMRRNTAGRTWEDLWKSGTEPGGRTGEREKEVEQR